MNEVEMKCVMVIDSELPAGVVANTCAILGITLGKHIPQQVGEDVKDATDKTHLGIITIPVSMLKGDKEILKALRERLYGEEFGELIVADFSDVAQTCQHYGQYIEKAAATPWQQHNYYGIALYGSKKKINKLTGFMPLLR